MVLVRPIGLALRSNQLNCELHRERERELVPYYKLHDYTYLHGISIAITSIGEHRQYRSGRV